MRECERKREADDPELSRDSLCYRRLVSSSTDGVRICAVYKQSEHRENSRRSDSAAAVATVRAHASSQDHVPVDSDSTGQLPAGPKLADHCRPTLELRWAWAPWAACTSAHQDRRSSTPLLPRHLNLFVSPCLLLSGVDQAALVQRHTKRILLESSKPPANRPLHSVPVGCHDCWLWGGGESGRLLSWADRHNRGTPESPYHITKASYPLSRTPLRGVGYWPPAEERGAAAQDQPFHNLCSAVSPAAQAHLPRRTDLLLFISSRQSRTTPVSDAVLSLPLSFSLSPLRSPSPITLFLRPLA